MTVKREDIQYLISTIVIWTALNLILNLIGLGSVKLLSEYSGNVELNIFWHLKFTAFQSLIFTATLVIVFVLTRKKKTSLYSFTILQFILFHLIFFMNLVDYGDGKYNFSVTDLSWEYSYLFANRQNFIDLVYIFYPLTGIFEDGMFVPEYLFKFYFMWIFLTLLYYLLVSWLTNKLLKTLVWSKSLGRNIHD